VVGIGVVVEAVVLAGVLEEVGVVAGVGVGS